MARQGTQRVGCHDMHGRAGALVKAPAMLISRLLVTRISQCPVHALRACAAAAPPPEPVRYGLPGTTNLSEYLSPTICQYSWGVHLCLKCINDTLIQPQVQKQSRTIDMGQYIKATAIGGKHMHKGRSYEPA